MLKRKPFKRKFCKLYKFTKKKTEKSVFKEHGALKQLSRHVFEQKKCLVL